MAIENILRKKIIQECNKLILRHHSYHNNLHAEWLRAKKRVIDVSAKEVKTPEYWKENKKFDPFYVKSNVAAIAKSIAKKILNREYVPYEPYSKEIPKTGGGSRKLTIYQIPDAAISNYFYERLLSKNKHRFSSFSYAYRNDRNVHFAIQDITVDLSLDARTFIAEFDFSDFFGSIEHGYLFDQFKKNGFFISPEDDLIIKAFLKAREKGIPQGTSLSLFLANLVCWKLDKSLEKEGLKFARYADDTVVWSRDYSSICKAFTCIENFSREAGVAINSRKSDGIHLLARKGLAVEIASKDQFDFLGYSIGVDHVSIKNKAKKRIMKQVSYLLYKNLIQPLKDVPLRGLVIPSNGKDIALLTAMMQIRRYLYGGLLHRDILDYIKGRKKYLYFKGIMSFYPLLNDEQQLKELDGWLVSVIDRAVKKRANLLLSHKYNRSESFPFNVKRNDIVKEYRKKRVMNKKLLEVPSFLLIYKAIQKGLLETGIEKVMHPESNKYAYGDE